MEEANEKETVTDQSEAEVREKFANWPNVVATLKLYLDEDGDLGGVFQFDGPKVKEMGLSAHKMAKLYSISQLVMRDAQKALTIGVMTGKLLDIFVGDSDDDSKGEGNDGGDNGDEQRAGATSSVSGD